MSMQITTKRIYLVFIRNSIRDFQVGDMVSPTEAKVTHAEFIWQGIIAMEFDSEVLVNHTSLQMVRQLRYAVRYQDSVVIVQILRGYWSCQD